MKMMKAIRPSMKLGLLAPLVVCGAAVAPSAWADGLLPPQTNLVNGTQSMVETFSTPSAGTVTVSLQSIDWPAQLSALSFVATSADQTFASWSLGGTNITGGTVSFDVGSAGTYFAHIMATAGTQNNPLNLGLYSLNMSFTPSVPLPASGWMLLTGIFVAAGLVRAARPFELMGTASA